MTVQTPEVTMLLPTLKQRHTTFMKLRARDNIAKYSGADEPLSMPFTMSRGILRPGINVPKINNCLVFKGRVAVSACTDDHMSVQLWMPKEPSFSFGLPMLYGITGAVNGWYGDVASARQHVLGFGVEVPSDSSAVITYTRVADASPRPLIDVPEEDILLFASACLAGVNKHIASYGPSQASIQNGYSA